MNNDVLQKIAKLKEQFIGTTNGSLEVVSSWESDVKQALVTANISSLPPVQKFLKSMKISIDDFNYLLQNDRTLNEEQRGALFDRKEVYMKFIGLFVSAEDVLKSVEAMVDDNLDEKNDKELSTPTPTS